MIEKISTIPVNIINGGYGYCKAGEICKYITEPVTMGDYLIYILAFMVLTLILLTPILAGLIFIRYMTKRQACNTINC